MNGFVTKDIDPANFYFTTTIGELISDYVADRIPDKVNKGNIELRKSTIIWVVSFWFLVDPQKNLKLKTQN